MKTDLKAENVAEESQKLADVLLDITKNRFEHIECDDIAKLKSKPAFIHLGREADIYYGKYKHILSAAALDTFNNPRQVLNYYHNSDVECWTEYGGMKKYPPFVLNLHQDMELATPSSDLETISDILAWISFNIVYVDLTWSERAYNLLQSHEHNAMVLMLPE